ncbi:MAG: radical SAM protein [Nanoarchaeota archaeon]|nr:radical SAM protein [Nanoarchaeota archaeon]
MNKKIALINPPSPFLIDERVFPNVGLLNVATAMRNEGYAINVFDLCGNKEYKEKIKEIANKFKIFGFSSTTAQFPYVYEMNRIIKEINPSSFTIIGGAHPSAVYSSMIKLGPKEIKNDPNIASLEESVDLIWAGEGDRISLEKDFKGKKWIHSEVVHDIDSIPIPDRSFFDINSYHYELNGRKATTIMTQRGCPFSCIFCCGRKIPMYNKFRQHSVERVIEEMDYLNKDFGFDAFMWFDDEININNKRLLELCNELKKKDYIHRGFVRSDLIVKFPELVDALADAGFVELCTGVESGSDRILKIINKGTTAEINLKAAEMIKSKGIRYKAFTILGHPSETYEDVMLTKQWLLNAKPDGFDVTILVPYPGSKIYEEAELSSKYKNYSYGYKDELFFNKVDFSKKQSYYKGIPGEYFSPVRTNELTAEGLVELRDKLEEEIRRKLF